VPVIIIARFAVDKAHHGHGIGKAIICNHCCPNWTGMTKNTTYKKRTPRHNVCRGIQEEKM
jgi:GNAT superfamily N-acetyltransferase